MAGSTNRQIGPVKFSNALMVDHPKVRARWPGAAFADYRQYPLSRSGQM